MKNKAILCGSMLLATLLLSSCRKKETVYEQIAKDAKTFTEKNCPKKMDDYTIMDSTTYDMKTNTFTYHYTVFDKLEDSTVYTDELRNNFHQMLLKGIKGSIPMKGYKEAGVTFVYKYIGRKNHKTMMQLKFSPKDYQ